MKAKMANTFTQIHIHFVFAVKYRNCVIHDSWKDELYKYITGIVQNNKHKMICINGMQDHVHVLIGLKPIQSVSDLMQDIKGSSSKWINERKFVQAKFEWQEGYGGFSYGKSQLRDVINYIENQEKHHGKRSFIDEYRDFLKLFDVEFDEKFVFKDLI